MGWSDTVDIRSDANKTLRKLSMLTLALLPVLGWYEIPFPVGLGYAIVLFLSGYTIVVNRFRINILPLTFWFVFGYVCFMRAYHLFGSLGIGAIIPPGGWIFFTFFLALLWGILTFDFKLLKKYMLCVVVFSALLFWVQYITKLNYGTNTFCFVPNLTGSFTYEDLTYKELVNIQLHSKSGRPCSIFLEPSYMAYYYITYLAISWFSRQNKDKWLRKDTALVIITLIVLKSGSGLVGLIILAIVKFYLIFHELKLNKRILVIFILIPIIVGCTYMYIRSEAGQDIINRSEELSTEDSSGFTRVIGGIIMFDQLNNKEKIIGIANPKETFGTVENDGSISFYANGVQTILLSLGFIGLGVYIIFYASLFTSIDIVSKMCILVLLVLSLIESNYLNSYMMLLTIIPCADYFWNNRINLRDIKNLTCK